LRNHNDILPSQERDDWFKAKILGRKEISVPHTSLIMKVFSVSYEAPKESAETMNRNPEYDSEADEKEKQIEAADLPPKEMETITEHDVTSDRIRLLCTGSGAIQLDDGKSNPVADSLFANAVLPGAPVAASAPAPVVAPVIINESTGTLLTWTS
jgi:hypothetical protein